MAGTCCPFGSLGSEWSSQLCPSAKPLAHPPAPEACPIIMVIFLNSTKCSQQGTMILRVFQDTGSNTQPDGCKSGLTCYFLPFTSPSMVPRQVPRTRYLIWFHAKSKIILDPELWCLTWGRSCDLKTLLKGNEEPACLTQHYTFAVFACRCLLLFWHGKKCVKFQTAVCHFLFPGFWRVIRTKRLVYDVITRGRENVL